MADATTGPSTKRVVWNAGGPIQIANLAVFAPNCFLVEGDPTNIGAYVLVGENTGGGPFWRLAPGLVVPFTCMLNQIYMQGIVAGDAVCWSII